MSDKYKGKADDIDKLVGKRLKMRRVILGLNQQDIGKVLGVSTQQIGKYENGTNRISSGTLFALAKFLKVPVTYFYEKFGDNYLCSNGFASEKELISLVKAFMGVKNPQNKKQIIALIVSTLYFL